ncbi:hypothetical protein FRC03_003510 [Tulasnella sp. 419]|nr:hypothetical protein FRC03_003510 [Tulasnella sp. 419]
MIVLFMWLTLPVFWGSLSETSKHVPNLHGWLVVRDSGALGQAMQQAFQANSNGQDGNGNSHLTWWIRSGDEVGDDTKVMEAVTENRVWAAVVVETDATAKLIAARAAGDASYNPQSAITFYYNQGRNEIATNSFIVPLTQALLQKSLARFSAQFTAQYLNELSTSGNAPASLATLARAPQTVSQPFGYTPNNLRPFTKTVATAILLVGQIYITIFAFVMTMNHDAARGVIAPFLRFRSYVKLRLIVPLIAYIPISFSYAMVSLPFKMTFDAKYGYGGGFFIFWLFIYMGMAALGLSTEAMITLTTPKFIAFFLLALIIFNVSTASNPIILQPGFYRYGYGFPIYNLGEAIRVIIFNTKNTLGKNAGVLIAWIILSCITIPLFTWFTRRKDVMQVERTLSEEGKLPVEREGKAVILNRPAETLSEKKAEA